nr:hypothetical protein [Pedobacter panaciterrae]
MNKYLLFFLCIILLGACAKDYRNQAEVYNNDFEQNNLVGISGGEIETFNNSKVLGRYNNGGFELSLTNLPEHDLIDISFDLYIHDSWEGNKPGQDDVEGPDIWQLLVNNTVYINTTFSNIVCQPGYFCDPQSYPANYPNYNNNPKSGVSNRNLPGACSMAGVIGGTSLYKISKQIRHSDKQLLLKCLDKLVQKNVADPKCDESWSIDNLKIKAIRL